MREQGPLGNHWWVYSVDRWQPSGNTRLNNCIVGCALLGNKLLLSNVEPNHLEKVIIFGVTRATPTDPSDILKIRIRRQLRDHLVLTTTGHQVGERQRHSLIWLMLQKLIILFWHLPQ